MGDDAANLLRDYVSATQEADGEQALTLILQDVAMPIVRAIAASVFRGLEASEEAKDVVAETMLHLVRRLRAMHDDPSRGIDDLRGYIATAAYHCCHERIRERFPARTRLRNHLRYLFGHDASLALWRGAEARMICGRREWAGQNAAADAFTNELSASGVHVDAWAEDRRQIRRLVFEIVDAVGSPVEFERMVEAIARWIGLAARDANVPLDASYIDRSQVPSSSPDALSLSDLWRGIQELPLKQRMALLLNLRDAHGREILSLLPNIGVATIQQIRELLQMTPVTFAALWDDLPLPDKTIAELLGVAPKQVIKLRRLARERLRRMLRRRENIDGRGGHRHLPVESRSSLAGGIKAGGGTQQ
jgi:DNA-directed RNA polymerase specialized sigma24 family protein